jgi:hypothetical protein
MQSDNILKHHAALVDRMAGTLGLDLEEIALRGALSVEEIGDAVLACTGCTRPGDCAHWLDAHDEGASHPPGYCRNAELFARLTPG